MKITKYEHACLDIEEQGEHLIIDPGSFVETIPSLRNIVAVIVTHVHLDHFNIELIRKINTANPGMVLFGPAEVTGQVSELLTITVGAGESHKVNKFSLKFFGGTHAYVYDQIPNMQNVGVLINREFYYPGDSFAVPDVPIPVLALPAGGPWLKAADAIDFLRDIKPKKVFPTHTIHLSDEGISSHNAWFSGIAKEQGFEYSALDVGKSLEI